MGSEINRQASATAATAQHRLEVEFDRLIKRRQPERWLSDRQLRA
jgi:hypothetical protein